MGGPQCRRMRRAVLSTTSENLVAYVDLFAHACEASPGKLDLQSLSILKGVQGILANKDASLLVSLRQAPLTSRNISAGLRRSPFKVGCVSTADPWMPL